MKKLLSSYSSQTSRKLFRSPSPKDFANLTLLAIAGFIAGWNLSPQPKHERSTASVTEADNFGAGYDLQSAYAKVEIIGEQTQFYLKILQFYPSQSLDSVQKLLTNTALMAEVSEPIIKAWTEARTDGKEGYKLVNQVEKHGFRVKVSSNCTETLESSQWRRTCHLSLGTLSKQLVNWGKTTNVCKLTNYNGVSCELVFEGSPKAFNFPGFSRSAPQFAIGGMIQSLKDSSALYAKLIPVTASSFTESMESTLRSYWDKASPSVQSLQLPLECSITNGNLSCNR